MPTPCADDPDPTTQLAWPSSRDDEASTGAINGGRNDDQLNRYKASTVAKPLNRNVPKPSERLPTENSDIGRTRLSTLQLFNLSISMAGAQIAWTVELG